MGEGKEKDSARETANGIWRLSSPAQRDISKQDVRSVVMHHFLPGLQTYHHSNLKFLLSWLFLTIVMGFNHAGDYNS